MTQQTAPTRRQQEEQAMWGLGIGLALGLIAGLLMGNLALGLIAGLALGVGLGTAALALGKGGKQE